MPLTFPSSPTTGQQAQVNGRNWSWTGNAWELVASSGGGSGQDTLLRSLFVPPAPTGLTATGGNAQASLSWTAPTVLTQTPITDYVVQYSTNSGSTWTTFSDGTSTSTSATVTGLTNGTAYVFRVAAVNGVGTGSYTAASASVTPQAAVFRAIPSMTSTTAPSGVVSTSLTPGSSISWRSGVYDGSGSDYWRAFDGSVNPGVRMNSGWIQYAFPDGQTSAAAAYRVRGFYDSVGSPTAIVLEGSDDGTSFTTIDSRSGLSWTAEEVKTFTFASTQTYRYWRWTVSPSSNSGYDNTGNFGCLQLVAPALFRAIPTMTSNTSPSGVVSGQTNGNGGNANGNADLWQVFDGNSSTVVYFGRASGNTPRKSVSYSFPDGQKSLITGYSIQASSDAPNAVELYGSDDGSTWTLLDARTGLTGQWAGSTPNTFSLAAAANYRAYRWDFDYNDSRTDFSVVTGVQLVQ